MKTENKQPTFPYVSYPAFKAFIAHLNDAVTPDQIDYTMMPRTMSGAVRAAVISALKSLGLIDAQGNTSQKLKDLADAYNDTNKWPEALKKNVLSAYAGIVGDIDLKSVTRKQVDDLFLDATPEMKEKCIRFFLSANKEAGVEYSPYLKIRRRLHAKRTGKATQKSESLNNPPLGEPSEEKTPSDMFDLPIPIASAEKCFIRVPRNITAEQVNLVKAAVNYIDAMAKQNEESK
ncbi:MAG: DUF5343 domain-containing protein [Sedimentisphaerales bacterium]|nr:DUF5343 domain-containing protein [Sedimentisphaerales bacterium]